MAVAPLAPLCTATSGYSRACSLSHYGVQAGVAVFKEACRRTVKAAARTSARGRAASLRPSTRRQRSRPGALPSSQPRRRPCDPYLSQLAPGPRARAQFGVYRISVKKQIHGSHGNDRRAAALDESRLRWAAAQVDLAAQILPLVIYVQTGCGTGTVVPAVEHLRPTQAADSVWTVTARGDGVEIRSTYGVGRPGRYVLCPLCENMTPEGSFTACGHCALVVCPSCLAWNCGDCGLGICGLCWDARCPFRDRRANAGACRPST